MASNTTQPEAPDLRKARLWEKFVASGTPPEAADMLVNTIPPELDALFLGQSKPQAATTPGAGGGYGMLSRIGGGTVRNVLGGLSNMAGAMAGGPALPNVQQQAAASLDPSDKLGLPTPEGSVERVTAMGLGGMTLGALGGVGGAIGGLTGGTAQQLSAEMDMNPLVQQVVGLLGGAVGGKFGQGMERRMGPKARSADAIRRAFEQEGLNPEAELRAAGQRAQQSPGMPLREAGGRPMQSVALRTAREGGTGGRRVVQAAATRLAELKDRFVAQVTRTMGGKANVKTESDLNAQFTPDVNKAYDAVRYTEVDLTPELIAKIDEPGVIRAINKGVDLFNEAAGARGAKKIPYITDAKGNFRQRVPLAVLDEVQRGYGAEGAAIADAGEARVHASRAEAISKAIAKDVEKQVDGYRVARALHAEHMGLQDAITFGRRLVGTPATRSLTRGVVNPAKTMDPNEAQIQWGKMTPEQRLLAKQAVVDGVERSPNPVNALKRAKESGQFIFTPDELASIDQLVREGSETMGAARQVVAAGKARPLGKPPGAVRRVVIDLLASMRRTIVRDMDQLSNEGPMFNAETREALADLLNSTGRQAQTAADATATMITGPRSAVLRGGLVGGVLGSEDRRER